MAEVPAVQNFRTALARLGPELQKALPKTVTPELFMRVVMTEMQAQPKLLQCSQMSVLKSLVQCAQLGLVPDRVRGLAYLVPFKGECTLIVGYRGMVDLALRSGQVGSVHARVVHEADNFDAVFGTTETLVHRVPMTGERGEALAAYCLIRMRSGEVITELMRKDEILAIKKRSKARDDGPWVTDELEMWKKTAVRRALKYAPTAPEAQLAAMFDELNDRSDKSYSHEIASLGVTGLEDDDALQMATEDTKATMKRKWAKEEPDPHGEVEPPDMDAVPLPGEEGPP